ncbi:hypothetical protein EDD16DRAFT_1085596 [Pisolithus croceorrhizus]|nr:hypothetical protein EDD16DRAFT_1085596 [Pisolithus croceorrhizus]
MKYVALLSGGKDSCFNLLHCLKNGHQLVAAATLSPESGKDEIDSYLYQTVGQDGIALIADALRVPLYRRVIHGHPLEQGPEYGTTSPGGAGTPGDETEDLYLLLETVLEHHPDVQGVAVGAILSNYQRVRVEHVCRRFSLTPLAYLWQRNQVALLSEMLATHIDAILIKVAGAGLTSSHLGLTLSAMHPTLLRLHAMYGTHPCGEGGEYESFTLDCPGIFKGKIVLQETEKITSVEGDVAPVAYLRIKRAEVVYNDEEDLSEHADVPVPPLLEPCFQHVRIQVALSLCSLSCTPPAYIGPAVSRSMSLPPSVRTLGPWIAVGNVRAPPENALHSIPEQLTQCFYNLKDILAQHSTFPPSEVLAKSAMITLFLPTLDSSTFAAANAAYSTFFGTSPPARACIAAGENVTLECVAWAPERSPVNSIAHFRESQTRKSLHVQSLSYWAPANIGPYSQAISISPWTFISGQIGLLPASLTLPASSNILPPCPPDVECDSEIRSCIDASSLALETALVLQHTSRVIRAAPISSRNGDEGGFGGSDGAGEDANADGQGGHVQLALYYLVDAHDLKHVQAGVTATNDPPTPTLYAVVSSLPRGARLEKVVVVHSGRCALSNPDPADDNGEIVECIPRFFQGNLTTTSEDGQLEFYWEASHFLPLSEACAVLFVRCPVGEACSSTVLVDAMEDAAKGLKSLPALAPFLERTLVSKIFPRPGIGPDKVLPLLDALFGDEMPALTVVPSQKIASKHEREWDWAVTLMAV